MDGVVKAVDLDYSSPVKSVFKILLLGWLLGLILIAPSEIKYGIPHTVIAGLGAGIVLSAFGFIAYYAKKRLSYAAYWMTGITAFVLVTRLL